MMNADQRQALLCLWPYKPKDNLTQSCKGRRGKLLKNSIVYFDNHSLRLCVNKWFRFVCLLPMTLRVSSRSFKKLSSQAPGRYSTYGQETSRHNQWLHRQVVEDRGFLDCRGLHCRPLAPTLSSVP